MTDTKVTDVLLQRVADGDATAASELLDRHRHRLRRMVAVRLDDRVSARVDPSDVVQGNVDPCRKAAARVRV